MMKRATAASSSPGHTVLHEWLENRQWKLAPFQQQAIRAFLSGKSGLLNAPTGSGKTYALWFPILIDYINQHPSSTKASDGLHILWITPLRALAKDLQRNMQTACDEMGIPWQVGIRTGDISTSDRNKQKRNMPHALIITPESLHLLFAVKESRSIFKSLHTVVVDEWHELLGSKRGVQTELALTGLRKINPTLRIWGISATIGNLEEARNILLGNSASLPSSVIIRATTKKKIIVQTILPDKIESLPWSGYMGISLVDKVIDIVKQSRTSLIFTNTRSQAENWYKSIIENYPEFAGISALHHGSLDKDLRSWVEEALHEERLKLVVCTSSLDLGVDFRPVETVIQVGSPKSVARFVQRAGRSGHQPGAVSKIYFAPTHSLELIEAVSLREGVEKQVLEERVPYINAYDVLAQWMVTRAVGEGFFEDQLYAEVKTTFCYQALERMEWEWLLGYITTGSASLEAYDEFRKVEYSHGLFKVRDKGIAMRHRLSMGTIMSDASLRVQFQAGKYLGSIEESFISRLKPGDVFWIAGMKVEFIRVREMTVTVRKETKRKGIVPQWLGGRMSLSSTLSAFIRHRLSDAIDNPHKEVEIKKLMPLLELQDRRSAIPLADELLIEQFAAKEGHHIFMFPFEGRLVHEGMAALIAYRIGKITPITFSISMNDYGFELLTDQYIDMQQIVNEVDLFSTRDLIDDIHKSVNATEMAKRRFREIASIAGLLFQGFPGKQRKTNQLQASAALLFDVFYQYEKDNLFVRQAFEEALYYQLDEVRLRNVLNRISNQRIIIKDIDKPSPLSFPLLVDRLREQMTTEKLNDRVQKMIKAYSDAD